MDRPVFSHQPTFVKIAVGLTVYNAFVFFEELIVDGYGIWQYLPFYKLGKLCIWDVAALAAIAWFTATGFVRKLKTDKPVDVSHPISVKLAVGLMFLNAFALCVGILERYQALQYVPAPLLILMLVVIVAGIAWWSWKRSPKPSSFGQQPIMIKVATALALGNLSIFVHYFAT